MSDPVEDHAPAALSGRGLLPIHPPTVASESETSATRYKPIEQDDQSSGLDDKPTEQDENEPIGQASESSGQPTAVVTPSDQTEHESSPVHEVNKKKRPATASDTEIELPKSGDRAADALRMRLVVLSTVDMPDNLQEWPKVMWEELYDTEPSEHGEYFALPIRDDWLPLVSPEILARLHQGIIDPRIRVAVREPAEGKSKLLAVSFAEFRDLSTTGNKIFAFGGVWAKLRQWHRHMVQGLPSYPLDEFVLIQTIYDSTPDWAMK
jgi:hypothetical protein